MIKRFESISCAPDHVAQTLTQLQELCTEVKIAMHTPMMTAMQQVTLLLVIECSFESEEQLKAFEEKFRPKVNSNGKLHVTK